MSVEATPISDGSASNGYVNQTDVELLFGVGDVAKWSQKDNAVTTADIRAVQRAIDDAVDIINDFLSANGYSVPITGAAGTVSRKLRNIAARLAGVELYTARGFADAGDEMAGKMQGHADYARAQLQGLVISGLGTGRSYPNVTPSGPTVAVINGNVLMGYVG